jgi:hypothetical protein
MVRDGHEKARAALSSVRKTLTVLLCCDACVRAAESLVDKAVELSHIGGSYGGTRKPTPFLCLLMKMLQIQPEMEIIKEFLSSGDYKYVCLLGAMYLRMVGKPLDVYDYLEPLLGDHRRVRRRMPDGTFVITHIDEVVDSLLTAETFFEISLPFLPPRYVLPHSLSAASVAGGVCASADHSHVTAVQARL